MINVDALAKKTGGAVAFNGAYIKYEGYCASISDNTGRGS